ncbi:alpha-hydroxy acid oxidase [Cupriavidus agavae]|uniref:4-hydroxymandelate oxidase n=1 Tax=Cupriavidus agavae TaxID=1001822 RepID=A0A4Q7RC69_9BURK|nr:alpha-hydroxy acid oxidase [Cupriavidus agavae]RZT30763.1 4-hydroxymandelate oxidase [Cupriavidus agavae]
MIPPDTVALCDYERHFHARVDPAIAAYVAGAAADGHTQRDNRAAFARLRLLPRALADLSAPSARKMLFGEALAYPILIAPSAYHRLVHPEGELATVHAASLTRTWMTVSTQASVTLEEIARRATTPLWFQLYFQPRREHTLALVRRAEQAGYRALVVTLDATVSGVRNAEQRAGFRLPAGVSAVNLDGLPPLPAGDTRRGSPVFRDMLRDAPTWRDLDWLCGQTRLPVLVKGLLHPADVPLALDAGVAGIIVSNHGGRTLDTVPATIDALPAVVQAVAGAVPVLVDGGIRRGTDIVKAIALGASAVMVGQPILHALAVGGMPGVAHALTLLQTELEIAMALTGRVRLETLEPDVLMR